ncbi:MAG: dihydrodipicolinate synthase family protein [Pyrinomonadaceae bacterium]
MKHPFNTGSEPAPATERSTNSLRGILLPFTTPFNRDEELDIEGLRANIRKWNAKGIIGYVALGSTGERAHLDEREYLQVISIAREEVPQNLAFIVGAGQQSTRGTIREIAKAATAGADAVLVITPHFYRAALTQEALVIHYKAVADASRVPVILYSMPDLTGIKIEPETVAELSKHQNILGIKDSSADTSALEKTVRLVPEDFAVMTGNGTVLAPALSLGARGGILAVGCVAAAACIEIYRLVRSGEASQAAALQAKLSSLALAVTKRYGIGGLKAALNTVGFAGGVVRAPLKPASEEAQREIASLLETVAHEEFTVAEGRTERDELVGVLKP